MRFSRMAGVFTGPMSRFCKDAALQKPDTNSPEYFTRGNGEKLRSPYV